MSLHLQNVGMEKNVIKERLELIEKLLDEVNSREEYLFLLGEREALLPLRYLIELKGGAEENGIGKKDKRV